MNLITYLSSLSFPFLYPFNRYKMHAKGKAKDDLIHKLKHPQVHLPIMSISFVPVLRSKALYFET